MGNDVTTTAIDRGLAADLAADLAGSTGDSDFERGLHFYSLARDSHR